MGSLNKRRDRLGAVIESEELGVLRRQQGTRPPLLADSYERICRWLRERSGMAYSERKRQLLLGRLQRVCDQHGLKNLDELANRVEQGLGVDIELAILHAASTNHTYFFREPQVLDFFRDHILPAFGNQSVRIWSAAASTGEEAYSVAMLCAQAHGEAWAQRHVSILGTDISAPVIAQAESAVYGASHLEHLPDELIGRYFRRTGIDQYRVIDPIRNLCTFRRLNLKARPFPFQQNFHVILCRNVLYYFGKSDQRKNVEAMYDVTEPGGWLLTSVTESLRDLDTRWSYMSGGIYRKVE